MTPGPNPPLKVLLCGTHYGSTYLDAMALAPRRYDLAGILARGSVRSRELAAQLGVPLYREAQQVPDGIDVACAALGLGGCEQVLAVLERCGAMLCEHPQPPRCVQLALAAAARRGAVFHINGHFPSLQAPAAFIQAARERCAAMQPRFVDAMVNDRALYAALDILRHATGSCAPEGFMAAGEAAPFTLLRGRLGGIPATIQIQPSGTAGGEKLQDASRGYLVDCRLALGFPNGLLALASVHGPAIWNNGAAAITDAETPLWNLLQDGGAPTAATIAKQRERANREALDAVVRQMRGAPAPAAQTPEHLLEVAAAWEALGVLLRSR